MKFKTLLLTSILSLPTVADNLSVFCPYGCPESLLDNDVINSHIYVLSNNPVTKFADWVAYEVTPYNFGVTTGRNWKADPLLEDPETLEPSDYKGSNTELSVDRGHQAPLASFVGSRYWYEANYLSNITPQSAPLNQGVWKYLEMATREAATVSEPLYVISGTIYQGETQTLPQADEGHVIPRGYYKIIYNYKGGVGFVMNQDSNRGDDYCDKITPLDEIQELLVYKLPEVSYSSDVAERLGCRL